RASRATAAPSRASARAAAAPMPRLAPVTTATFPSRLAIVLSRFLQAGAGGFTRFRPAAIAHPKDDFHRPARVALPLLPPRPLVLHRQDGLAPVFVEQGIAQTAQPHEVPGRRGTTLLTLFSLHLDDRARQNYHRGP